MYRVKSNLEDIVIDEFETLEEATECVENLEQSDKENDTYEPNAYRIVEG